MEGRGEVGVGAERGSRGECVSGLSLYLRELQDPGFCGGCARVRVRVPSVSLSPQVNLEKHADGGKTAYTHTIYEMKRR